MTLYLRMPMHLSRKALFTLLAINRQGYLDLQWCAPGYYGERGLVGDLVQDGYAREIGDRLYTTSRGTQALEELGAADLPEVTENGWCPALLAEGVSGPARRHHDLGEFQASKKSRKSDPYYTHYSMKWIAVAENWYPSYQGLVWVCASKCAYGVSVYISGADDYSLRRKCRTWAEATYIFDRIVHLATQEDLWGKGFSSD